MEKQITILTSTYNRAHLLGDLYNSLRRQTSQAFDWVIVDDGSQDNTKEIVEKWVAENNAFSIEYHYIPNGGKNRAINYGVKMVKTPYTMIVDSDDYLTDDAIEYLTPKTADAFERKEVAGISALKGKDAETPLCSPMFGEKDYITANNLERKNYKLERDACEVYKTEILREHSFEVWKGEKFVPEEIVWNNIALEGYSLRWYNKVTCIVRYQEEGLTKGSFALLRNNPMGYAMMYNQRILLSKSFKEKFYNAVQMVALIYCAKNFNYLKESNNKPITVLALLPGIALGIRRKIQFTQ
jgi:glycosyltransferase involved in cell wall biosynthesis